MQFKDYYQTMGVDKGATPEDIKRAHRKLARKYHPDVSKEADAEAQFKALAEAYDVLKDPEKRAAYDEAALNQHAGQDFRPPPDWQTRQHRSGNAGTATGGFEGFSHNEHSDFFDALFRGMGSGPAQERQSADRHGQDQHARIQVTLQEVYQGATRTIELQVPATGPDGRQHTASRTLEFTIPRGIRAGQHIRLTGQGLPGSGQGHAGDLYLDVDVLPHPLFRLDSTHPGDVEMDLPLSPWEAALGAELEVPTPTGRVEVKVAAGSQAGRKLRLKGRGLPTTRAGKPAGDFFFTLRIVQPTAETDEQRRAFEALGKAFPAFAPRATLAHDNGFAVPTEQGTA